MAFLLSSNFTVKNRWFGDQFSYLYPCELEIDIPFQRSNPAIGMFLTAGNYDYYVVPVFSTAQAVAYASGVPVDNYYTSVGANMLTNPVELVYVGSPTFMPGKVYMGFAYNALPDEYVTLTYKLLASTDWGPSVLVPNISNQNRYLKDHYSNPLVLENDSYVQDIYSATNRGVRFLVFIQSKSNPNDVVSYTDRYFIPNLKLLFWDSSPVFRSKRFRIAAPFPSPDTLQFGEVNDVEFIIESINGCNIVDFASDPKFKMWAYVFEDGTVPEFVNPIAAHALSGREITPGALPDTLLPVYGVATNDVILGADFDFTSPLNSIKVKVDASKLSTSKNYRVGLVCQMPIATCDPAQLVLANHPDVSSVSFLSPKLSLAYQLKASDIGYLSKSGFKGLNGTYGPNIETCTLDRLTSIVEIDMSAFNQLTNITGSFPASLVRANFIIYDPIINSTSKHLLFRRSASAPNFNSFTTFSTQNNRLAATQEFTILESPNVPNLATIAANGLTTPPQSNQDWRNRLLICEWQFTLAYDVIDPPISENTTFIVRQRLQVNADADPRFNTEKSINERILCEESDTTIDFCTTGDLHPNVLSGTNLLSRVVAHAQPFTSQNPSLQVSSVRSESSKYISRSSDLFDSANTACASLDIIDYFNDNFQGNRMQSRVYHQAIGSGYAANFTALDNTTIFSDHNDEKYLNASQGDVTISAWIYLRSAPPVNEKVTIVSKRGEGTSQNRLIAVPTGPSFYFGPTFGLPEVFLELFSPSAGVVQVRGGWSHFKTYGAAPNAGWRALHFTTVAPFNLALNRWYHIMWVKPKNSFKINQQQLYINGEATPIIAVHGFADSLASGQHHWDYLAADNGSMFTFNGFNVQQSPVSDPEFYNTGPLVVGQRMFCGDRFFSGDLTAGGIDGMLKEVRIQKTAYNGSEALSYYNEGIGALGKDLEKDLVWYRFNSTSSILVCDSSYRAPLNGFVYIRGQYPTITSFTDLSCGAPSFSNLGTPIAKFNFNQGFWIEC